MKLPTHCPSCRADFDAGLIPDHVVEHYAGNRYSRVISVLASSENYQIQYWKCPDCKFEFDNDGKAINEYKHSRSA